MSEQGFEFDVSDSWDWVGGEGSDIRLTVEVFRLNGPDWETMAERTHTIPLA